MFGFPLLLIPLAIFNIIVFLMPGVVFTAPVVVVRLMSGADWTITLGDLLLALAIVMLLFEAIKVARGGGRFLADHLLSLVVLCAAAAEFLLLDAFGNSIYFLLCALCFVDFVMGVALHRRRVAPSAVAPPAVTSPPPAGPPSTDHEPVERKPVPNPAPKPAPVPLNEVVPASDTSVVPEQKNTTDGEVTPSSAVPPSVELPPSAAEEGKKADADVSAPEILPEDSSRKV